MRRALLCGLLLWQAAFPAVIGVLSSDPEGLWRYPRAVSHKEKTPPKGGV